MKKIWSAVLALGLSVTGLAFAPAVEAGHYGKGFKSHGPVVNDVHRHAHRVSHPRLHRAGPPHRVHPHPDHRHRHGHRHFKAPPRHRHRPVVVHHHYRPAPRHYYRTPVQVIHHPAPVIHYPPRVGVTIHLGY